MSEGASLVLFLGRMHPLAVHLPIGILLLAGVLEGLTRSTTLRGKIDPVLAIVLRLALAASVVAAALGLLLATGDGYTARLLSSIEVWRSPPSRRTRSLSACGRCIRRGACPDRLIV